MIVIDLHPVNLCVCYMQEWIHWCHHRLDPLSQRHFRAYLYRRLPLDRDRLFSLLRLFSETLRVFQGLAFRSLLQSEITFCIMAIPPASFDHISLILDGGFFLKSSPRFVNSFSINEALNSGLAVSAARNSEYSSVQYVHRVYGSLCYIHAWLSKSISLEVWKTKYCVNRKSMLTKRCNADYVLVWLWDCK